jgi:hypothetical protein
LRLAQKKRSMRAKIKKSLSALFSNRGSFQFVIKKGFVIAFHLGAEFSCSQFALAID